MDGGRGQLSAALQSAFWQKQHEHSKAPEIIDSFGEDARAASTRILQRRQELPRELEEALPQLLDCLNGHPE